SSGATTRPLSATPTRRMTRRNGGHRHRTRSSRTPTCTGPTRRRRGGRPGRSRARTSTSAPRPLAAVVVRKVALDHREVERLEDRLFWLALEQESKAVSDQFLDRPAFAPPLEVACGHPHHVVTRRAAVRDIDITSMSVPVRGTTHLHRHRP